jgi:hypothetical protein
MAFLACPSILSGRQGTFSRSYHLSPVTAHNPSPTDQAPQLAIQPRRKSPPGKSAGDGSQEQPGRSHGAAPASQIHPTTPGAFRHPSEVSPPAPSGSTVLPAPSPRPGRGTCPHSGGRYPAAMASPSTGALRVTAASTGPIANSRGRRQRSRPHCTKSGWRCRYSSQKSKHEG